MSPSPVSAGLRSRLYPILSEEIGQFSAPSTCGRQATGANLEKKQPFADLSRRATIALVWTGPLKGPATAHGSYPCGAGKNIAQHRVRQEGSRLPGFGGAYLVGSVTTFADGVALPGTSDVDIAVVSNCAPPPKLGKFLYRRLLLDVSFVAWKQVQSHETVLGHSQMAAGFRAWNILADPKDHSARIQQEGAIALCRSLLGATTSSARQ